MTGGVGADEEVGGEEEREEGDEDGEEELLEEEEEDDAALPPPATSSPIRLEAEYSVVWSASYRVPMLCFRAWDESESRASELGPERRSGEVGAWVWKGGEGRGEEEGGYVGKGGGGRTRKGGLTPGGTPAPLASIAAHLLRADIPTSTDPQARADALMLPSAPFPLIQAGEHPVTGGNVWSVHPCEVRNAVEEIVLADELEDEGKKEGKKGEGEGERSRGVRWLEAWFMLTDSVVDLTL